MLIADVVAGSKILVGDVEGRQHRDLQRVSRRTLFGGCTHPFVDVRRQLGDVGGVERAANRVPLPVDLDVNDADGLIHK